MDTDFIDGTVNVCPVDVSLARFFLTPLLCIAGCFTCVFGLNFDIVDSLNFD